MEAEKWLTVQDGEDSAKWALRVGYVPSRDGSIEEFVARHERGDSVMRQDGGEWGEDGVALDANEEAKKCFARKVSASGVSRPVEDAEAAPDAAAARAAMVKRQRDAWKTRPKKKAEPGPKPPTSASAEAEGDDDSEEGEEDAAAARQRMIDQKYGRTK